MIILKSEPCSNGAYANQIYDGDTIPNGYISIPEQFVSEWEQYKPFVTITVEDGVITSMVDNPTAREAQQAIDAQQISVDTKAEIKDKITKATTIAALRTAMLEYINAT